MTQRGQPGIGVPEVAGSNTKMPNRAIRPLPKAWPGGGTPCSGRAAWEYPPPWFSKYSLLLCQYVFIKSGLLFLSQEEQHIELTPSAMRKLWAHQAWRFRALAFAFHAC